MNDLATSAPELCCHRNPDLLSTKEERTVSVEENNQREVQSSAFVEESEEEPEPATSEDVVYEAEHPLKSLCPPHDLTELVACEGGYPDVT